MYGHLYMYIYAYTDRWVHTSMQMSGSGAERIITPTSIRIEALGIVISQLSDCGTFARCRWLEKLCHILENYKTSWL